MTPDAPRLAWQTFETWTALIAWVRTGRPLYYQAPLDYKPVRVIGRIQNFETIRVYPPPSSDADPFNADVDHLARFRKLEQ